VILTDACGLEIYDTVVVSVGPVEFIDLGPDLTLCDGQLWTFNVMTPGATYLWSNGSTLPTLTIDEAGTYWVVVTDGACVDADTVNVTYMPAPDIVFPEDTIICGLGTEFILDATTEGATYEWQDGSEEPFYTITDDGLYFVTVTIGGCSDKDSILVSYSVSPDIELGEDFSLCTGTEALISTGTSGFEYEWSDGSTNETLTVTEAGTYWVDVTVNECTARDTIVITPDPCICIVTAPNAFSPNGDGINDTFKQIDCDFLTQYLLTVYNRWGEIIFQTTDFDGGWDGSYDGAECDMGTYVYTIEFTRLTGEEGMVTGNVVLVR
jgi:gliding motility-associated-like protein